MTDDTRDASCAADDEEALVRLMIAYQAGRLDAFEGLYRALAEDLRRYFVLVARDGSAAQDLVQDTFMEIHRARRTYLPPRPVRPWIFGIAKNVHRRHRRGELRRARHEDRWSAAAAAAVAAVASADQSTSAHARAHAHLHGAASPTPSRLAPHEIEDAVARLPASRREPWLLHHVHGFSFEEIAHRLRIGVGAAKLRSSRAMRALRTMLGVERGGRDD